MKVLLVNPAIFFIDGVSDRPPLGLLYLSSVLKENGIHVRVVDLALRPNADLEAVLLDFKPDLVGISMTTPVFVEAARLAEIIKNILPDSIIVAGGPHPSSMPVETLKGFSFDIVVAGEGESTFLELVKALESDSDLAKVQGIYYKSGSQVCSTAPRRLIADIDGIPFPARELVSLSEYAMEINGIKATPMITSRGCPYQCVYCTKSIFGNRCRVRSPENIVCEIKKIISEHGIKGILFVDDTFTIYADRIHALCDRIIEEKLDITWRCWTRSDKVNRNLLEKMYASGCRVVCFGVESGDQRILDRSRKGASVESNLNAIKTSKAVGLHAKAFFMVGLPGENKESIDNTIQFMRSADPDSAHFYVTTPFPQTHLWNYAEDLGIRIVSRDWRSYYHAGKNGDAPAVIETAELSLDAIIEMHQKLRNEFDRLKNPPCEKEIKKLTLDKIDA